MTGWAAVLFVVAAGFTAAVIVSAFTALVTGQHGAARPSFASLPAFLWSAVLCAFGGPYLVIALALPAWRSGRIAHPLMAGLAALSGLWSFCSGVLVVQACLLVGAAL